MNRFSLRTRLVAVAVALVAVAVVATGIATYAALHGFLYSRLDDQLEQAARGPTAVCLDGTRGSGLPRPGSYLAKLTTDGAPVTITCATGRPISTLLELPADAGVRLAASPGRTLTVRSTDGSEFHAIAVPATPFDPAGVDWTVIALPIADVRDTLSKLLGLELVVGAAAVVGTGVVGAAGVRLGLRPLDRVTRTARTVAAELGPDGTGLDR